MAEVIRANRLAILTVGRVPSWTEQSGYTGAPASASAGVSLTVPGADTNGAPATDVVIRLRAVAGYRTVTLTIDTLVLTGTWTVVVNGTSVAYNATAGAPADAAALLTAIAAAINADGTVNLLVLATATDTDDDAVVDAVVITGKAALLGVDYSVSWSVTGGGDLAGAADAVDCTLDGVWSTPLGARGTTPPGAIVVNGVGDWNRVPGTGGEELDYGGYGDRYATAGRARLYVQLSGVDGHADDDSAMTFAPRVFVGPCVLE